MFFSAAQSARNKSSSGSWVLFTGGRRCSRRFGRERLRSCKELILVGNRLSILKIEANLYRGKIIEDPVRVEHFARAIDLLADQIFGETISVSE